VFPREELLALRRRMAEFQRWKDDHPTPPREFSAVLADLSWLLGFIPPVERRRDPDPEKLGIQRMRAALGKLGTGRR
jgi:hypothetical protein